MLHGERGETVFGISGTNSGSDAGVSSSVGSWFLCTSNSTICTISNFEEIEAGVGGTGGGGGLAAGGLDMKAYAAACCEGCMSQEQEGLVVHAGGSVWAR